MKPKANERPASQAGADADTDSDAVAIAGAGVSGDPGEGAAENTISANLAPHGAPDIAAGHRVSLSRKSLLAAGMVMAFVATAGLGIDRALSGHRGVEEADAKQTRDRPAAAMSEPRRLDMSSAASSSTSRIPALAPTADELGEPIGIRRTGSPSPAAGRPTEVPEEDAPILLVTTRPGAAVAPAAAQGAGGLEADPQDALGATSRNLQGYQRQLQGLLDQLTQSTALASAPANAASPWAAMLGGSGGGATGGVTGGATGGLFGGQLAASVSGRATASMLGNRSLTLPKGTAFTCALKTRIISANSGMVGCQVQRNVFSDDGRVLLIERGSHLDGEYRIASVRPGTVRIPVLWTRVRTPLGVTVDLESPATGPLGESGIDGHVDNRWGERIGAAMLLSLIDDSVKLVVQSSGNSDRQGDTIVLPSTTAGTSKLAEKVLDSTVNIAPLVYRNQGGVVGIYVARDVDFSSVYELRPVDGDGLQEGAR